MSQASSDSSTSNANIEWMYRNFAWLLIGIAIVVQIARVLGMTAAHGELPFLSANDRSRWTAVAALTEDGAWEIDRVIEILDSKGKSKIWNTIDMVRHRGADGAEHYYSSKPPLLTAMYALVCKPITMITGKKLTEEPFLIGRTVMVVVNIIPLALWWIWLHRWLLTNVADYWSRFILLNIGLWGTFLTTFAATLNNHLHGALFFTLSLTLAWSIRKAAISGNSQNWLTWIACGLCAGLTVACELPALAWAVALGAILALIDVRKFLIGYGIGTASIAVAFLATNYWAHGDLRPPYSHRGVGALIGNIPRSADSESPSTDDVRELANKNGYQFTDQLKTTTARLTGVQQFIDDTVGQRVAIKGLETNWGVYHWDDWYDFPKSYWLPGNKKGVDLGEENRLLYIVHFMVGHHGIFSVTPVWILSIVGAVLWIRRSERLTLTSTEGLRRFAMSDSAIALALVATSIACFVFYASRDVEDRNYAGVCSGFRWVFWLVPAWIWLSVPAIERAAGSNRMRGLVAACLLISVFSATIPWPNPWTHPWPYKVAIWLYPEKVDAKP